MLAPQVSIVIPTFNHAKFLNTALNSVFSQTFTNWECIVVNNFSQDSTVEIVESYRDPRIRCINFANHGVIAASRNFGIQLTRAPYIAFLDSDDQWYPGKLHACLDRMSAGYDMVCHAEKWVGPGKKSRIVKYGPEERATYRQLLFNGNCLSTSAIILKRALLDQVGVFSEDPRFITAEDYDLWLRLAQAGARIGFVDGVLGEYIIHGENQSGAALRNSEAVRQVVLHHFSAHAANERHAWLERRRLAIVSYGAGRSLQGNGRHRAAWRYFLRAIRQYPFMPRFYAAMMLNAFGMKS